MSCNIEKKKRLESSVCTTLNYNGGPFPPLQDTSIFEPEYPRNLTWQQNLLPANICSAGPDIRQPDDGRLGLASNIHVFSVGNCAAGRETRVT